MKKTETQCIYRLLFVFLSTAKLNIFQQICFVSIETTFDRNNLWSKIQGCIDIVRKIDKVCYMDFLLNMSLSKINKSVVQFDTFEKGTLWILSLLTLVFIHHVLLMLFWRSLRICFFHSYQTYVSGMSLQTCFSMFVHIICLREMTVHYWAKFASLFGRTSLTFVVHSRRLGIVIEFKHDFNGGRQRWSLNLTSLLLILH